MSDEPEQEPDAPVETLNALRDLVQSPGWKILAEHVDRVWGPRGYGIEMQRAIANVPQGPDRPYEIARVAEQVENTAQAVMALVRWPGQEIVRLTEKKTSSRRPFAGLRRSS